MLSALISTAVFFTKQTLTFGYFKNDGYVFLVPGLTVKGSKPHHPHLEIFLPSFPPDASLCVTSYVKKNTDITSNKRNNSSSLFHTLSLIKPSKLIQYQDG